MESPDNKTPPPAASRRPRLLNAGIQDKPDKAAAPSMLASLEKDGKFQGSAESAVRGRRRKYLAPLLGTLVLVSGAAAFYYRSSGDNEGLPSAARIALAPQGAASGSSSAVEAVQGAASAAAASSAPAPAKIEVAGAVAKAVEPSALLASSEAASTPAGARKNPLGKLALAEADSTAAAASSATGKKAQVAAAGARPGAKVVASAKTAAHADGKVPSPRKARTADEDADTELVAAMIARIDRPGANPLLPPSERAPLVGDAGLREKVRQCGTKGDLLEARRCRNKVCDTHWGKVDVCPASRAPKPMMGERVDNGSPG